MHQRLNNKNKSNQQKINTTFFSKPYIVVLCLSAMSTAVHAQSVNQLLDSTFMYGKDRAAEMAFNDASMRSPSEEYKFLGITGTDLRACQLNSFDGLFCLDGKVVRNWPTPAYAEDVNGVSVVESYEIIDCRDAKLGLDTRKDDTCTGMTVDFDGNIWIAGKNKGKTHSLIKLVRSIPSGDGSDPTCPDDVGKPLGVLDLNKGYCAFELATGRPLLVDIAPVDGRLAEGFSLPGHAAPLEAIIGLEERKTAVAFLQSGEVIEFAAGKQFWGLAGPEQLQGITLLQLVDATAVGSTQNIVLVTTSLGRVLSYDTSGDAPVQQVFDIPSSRETGTTAAGPCNADTPVFSIRASRRTDIVYVTDSPYCEVLALKPKLAAGIFAGLENVVEADGRNLTLSTLGLTAPTGVTVAAGSSINLGACGVGQTCSLVPGLDDQGQPVATLTGVKLAENSRSGMTLFQVEGMPDCRYVPFSCLDVLGITVPEGATVQAAVDLLMDENVIVPLVARPAAAAFDPAAQRLNVTPMMPTEITELFPGGMPDLLLPRYVRGQAINNFVFGGFFGRTQDGVVFRGTFEGEFEVGALANASLGCDFDVADPLAWDVIATVSERFGAAVDPGATPDPENRLHLATLTNRGCGSVKTLDDRWSFKPYNLEPTPCTFNPDALDNWTGGGNCVARDATMAGNDVADDAVYAKMLLLLTDELERTVEQLACTDGYGENAGIAPLSTADCLVVRDKVLNAADKFDKCWDAAQQPKQSAGDQNCQAYASQLLNLGEILALVVPQGTDVANRVGELQARTARLLHILESRFAPSLPDGGFVEP